MLLLAPSIVLANDFFGVKPVDMAPSLIKDDRYNEAYAKAVEAAAVQSGVWAQFEMMERGVMKIGEDTANKYINKHVLGTLGYSYDVYKNKRVNFKLSNKYSIINADHIFYIGFDGLVKTSVSWNF